MAIISFAKTVDAYLSGRKTVTRRVWKPVTFLRWARFWDRGRLIHDAWDKSPRARGRKIGEFRLTERPYYERLEDMPVEDLVREGGMCETLEEFFTLFSCRTSEKIVVVRFVALDYQPALFRCR